MKYDKTVECDGKLMSARAAALRKGMSPGHVMKLSRLGLPIERRKNEGRVPHLIAYKGQTLSAEELAPILGVTAETVRVRIREGRPLETQVRRAHQRLIEHDGRKQTVRQWAKELGVSRKYIYVRVQRGLPLTAPMRRGKSFSKKAPRLTESGVHRITRGEGENGLYWSDDLEARVWHLYCGGDNFGECSLNEIGALWGLSRERVRQVELKAINKIRRAAKLGKPDAVNALKWFRMRSEERSRERLSAWEQAALNAPGSFEAA